MKLSVFAILAVISALPVAAQTTQDFGGIGASFQPGGTPKVALTALYAKPVADTKTAAFLVADALPLTAKPFSFATNVGAGVAENLFSLGPVDFWVPTAAGITWSTTPNKTNTGFQASTGLLATIPIGPIIISPNVRVLKSTVSNNAGYQVIPGVLICFARKK